MSQLQQHPTPEALVRAWRQLLDCACAPYAQAGRFAWHFARGKLGRDPVFRYLLEHGELPPRARVVDIGCGQALLANLMQACHLAAGSPKDRAADASWPSAWGQPPVALRYHGIELMPSDVQRGQAALAQRKPAFACELVCADMCQALLPPCDAVVILDVLHYVDHAAQAALLARVKAALEAGRSSRQTPIQAHPRLLLRVGDAAQSRGFAVSQWVDRLVTGIRGHRVAPTYGRPVAQWVALLESLGFAVRPVPMSQGTPCANVLLLADLPPSVSSSAPESA